MTTTIMARIVNDTDTNAVIDYARHLAVQMKAKLVLFRSIYDPSAQQKDAYTLDDKERELESKAIKKARNELLVVANALREVDIEVDVSVNWRSPHHTAFTQLANRLKPILIVCGRSTSSLADSSVDADADWELYELTDIPVLYADHAPGQLPTNIIWAAVDPVRKQSGSNTLDNLLIKRAKYLAAASASELHLVHFQSSPTNMTAGSHNQAGQKSVGATQIEVDDDHMAALLKLADHHDIDRDKAHAFPCVSEAILPILADIKRPDIIVTGANSEGLVTQFPSGTTARKLINQITGALCIVRLPHTASKDDSKANVITPALA